MSCTQTLTAAPLPAAKESSAQNLFYTGEGKVVYFTAGVAVVYQIPSHSQYFFLGHTDDIKSLALCPVSVQMDHKEYPAKTVVATGQVRWCVHAYVCDCVCACVYVCVHACTHTLSHEA